VRPEREEWQENTVGYRGSKKQEHADPRGTRRVDERRESRSKAVEKSDHVLAPKANAAGADCSRRSLGSVG
jgi:hypothetical protein